MRRPVASRRGRVPVAEYGRLYLLLFCVTILSLAASEAQMVLAAITGRSVTSAAIGPTFSLLGILLLTFVYATTRDLDIALGAPASGERSSLAIVVLVPLAAVFALGGLATLGFDTSLQALVGGPVYLGAEPDVGAFIVNTLLPSVLTGIGFSVLINGVVQEVVREYVTPSTSVAIVTVLGALYASAVGSTLAGYIGSLLAAFALGTAAVVGLGAFVGSLWQRLDFANDATTVLAGAAGIGVVALVTGGWYVAATVAGLSFVGGPVGLGVAFATAAIAHERWRSVPLAVLVVVTYLAAVDVAVYLQHLAGMGP